MLLLITAKNRLFILFTLKRWTNETSDFIITVVETEVRYIDTSLNILTLFYIALSAA
jgi:hypothetical protein